MSTLTCEPIKLTSDPVMISDAGADTEYFELCARIGLRSKVTVRHELEMVLERLGVSVYNYEAVKSYMDDLVKRENETIRLKWNAENPEHKVPDKPPVSRGPFDIDFMMLSFRQRPTYVTWAWQALREKDLVDDARMPGIYEHAVPYPVLLQVERITEAFPEALFYVTAYQAIKPDPFLMVTHKLLSPGYVIERWDEPMFRDKSA